MKTIRIQIAINTPKEISTIFKVKYSVDITKSIPHISLYGGLFPRRNLKKILYTIQEITKEYKKFTISLADLIFINGYLFWPIIDTKDKQLNKLHKDIIEQINPYREQLLRDKFTDNKSLSMLPKHQKELALKYGSMWVFDYFNPHLTLYKSDHEINVKDYLTKYKLQIDNISVFEAGEHAICFKLIKSFDLT